MAEPLFMRYPGGLTKALTLSYDDGVDSDIRLMKILDEHGLKCTFNINSGCYASEGSVTDPQRKYRRLTEREATELYAGSGHEVAVHTLRHPHLENLSNIGMINEILPDRQNLERQFDGIVRGMAYPYGTYNSDVLKAVRICGIVYARTVVSTEKFDLPEDWLCLPATCHHRNPRLTELANSFIDLKIKEAPPKLFYLWGHSYEFVQNDNWEIIENFAQLMGGRKDIWYATNIEIYDYVMNYNRLIRSADTSQVYNPTNSVLWMYNRANGIVSVAPGEKKHLL